MISRTDLLSDLQSLLPKIEQDLLERSESSDVPEVPAALRAAFDKAQEAQRTAQNFEDWRTDAITQAAAAWVLSCVFVRFLEDNRLIDPPRISGPGERLKRARDEREIYFKQHPHDRAYLLSVFDDLAQLPGTAGLFGQHNPIRELPGWLSGDAAAELIAFFQKLDPDTGHLVHDFTDPDWDTRFLGDLYQDLSEAARKKYALLQTPEFVEEFILDRTLDPALEEFGLVTKSAPTNPTDVWPLTSDLFRMIDPACGSGHFLLGAFRRLLDRWRKQEPGTNARVLVQRALWSVHGVDVNPFAIAIARFRLLLAALKASGITRLAEAPAFEMHLVCGDSLLHGVGEQGSFGWAEVDHVTFAEDRELLKKILRPGSYHCVVANPPYITPKDRALNQAYRERYGSCHRQYSLAVPFMERIFRLAISGDSESERKALASGPTSKTPPLFPQPTAKDSAADGQTATGSEPGRGLAPTAHAGYAGQITANSFMKREFGKKLIEDFLPRIDLTHVIDTSGAYIPGHGTPTVILFGRNRKPPASTIRTVMGIRGEPSTPDDPSQGLVWTAITRQIDEPGSQSAFVSAGDTLRDLFEKHPWSIGGGGASELKEKLEELCAAKLCDFCEEIGFGAITREDEAYLVGTESAKRKGVPSAHIRPLVEGDEVRDWSILDPTGALWPYSSETLAAEADPQLLKMLWPARSILSNRVAYGNTQLKRGLQWFEYSMFFERRFRIRRSIVVAFVATHNHFVLDRGGKVFKQSAPVIKLPPDATEDDHLALLGLLNSSTACFWMQQTLHNKGGPGGGSSKDEKWHDFYEFSGTRLNEFPVPADRPVSRTRRILEIVNEHQRLTPSLLVAGWASSGPLSDGGSLRKLLNQSERRRRELESLMVFHQEELDWECLRAYGNSELDVTLDNEEFALQLGQRAFEISLARKIAAGEVSTEWFSWLHIAPCTELPADWPAEYLARVENRIRVIEEDSSISLIEQTACKRRWETEPWDSQLERALREWLLGRLETYFDFDGRMRDGEERSEASGQTPGCQVPVSTMTSVAKLADIARQDAAFLEVGELYRGDKAFDVQALVQDLVDDESVPLLPVLRYKPTGLRKRLAWEETWDLQRREDAGEQNLKIAVPPKYTSADFLKSNVWRLRGKLDVPKERWVSFPHAEGPDGTLTIAWAGYDHLQLAQAISGWYVDIKERHGGSADPRLVPLLAGLVELLPWLKQWHNEPNAEFSGLKMGDYFEGFLTEEARELGLTREELRNWTPPAKAKGRGKKGKGTAGQ